MNSYFQNLGLEIATVKFMLLAINAILHIIFAGAIAKDAGRMQKIGREPVFVGPFTWSFATLIGGVLVVGLYWFIHYSSFSVRRNIDV